MKVRPLWVLVHRYAGLAMTVFLAVVGLTGSLLAFYAELERVVSPQLYVEANGRKPLDLMGLVDSAARIAPQAQVQSLWINQASVLVFV